MLVNSATVICFAGQAGIAIKINAKKHNDRFITHFLPSEWRTDCIAPSST
jgi:hypothetical protein